MRDETKNIIRSACAMDASVDLKAVDAAIAMLDGGAIQQTDEILTADEVARMLRVTTRTVMNYADRGKIRRVGGRATGTQTRYSKRSVLDFMEGRVA